METVEVEERPAATLSALLKGGAGSVVTLVAGETSVAAHWAVLAARCPALAALADAGGQVAVAGVEGAELLELVAYCYTLQAPQLPDAASRLLAAAHRFGIPALQAECERQVAARLTADNAVAAAALAVRHSCAHLREAAVGFLRANLTQVMATAGWADALRLQPAEMAEVSRLLSELPVVTGAAAAGDGGRAPSAERHSDGGGDGGQAAATPAAGDGGRAPSAERHSDGGGDGGQAASMAAPPAAPLRIRKPDPAVVSRLRCINTTIMKSFLIEAAKEGSVRRLETMLAAGADVRARDGSKRTALHWAVERGHVEVVRFLLEPSKKLRKKLGVADEAQQTPLHVAARKGHAAIARLLLAASADPNASAFGGWTPLHLAASKGHAEVARILVEAGALVNAGQWTPLHEAAKKGDTAVVRLLTEASADPNARDRNGRTPLHEAAYSGDADTVAALLEAGADRGVTSHDWGETPLDIAIDKDHLHLIEVLS